MQVVTEAQTSVNTQGLMIAPRAIIVAANLGHV